MIAALCTAVLLASTAPDAGTPEEPPPAPNRLMSPGDVDLKVIGGTNIVLVNVNFGALAEVGLLRIGGGTLSFGLELDYGLCASLCGVISFITGLTYGQQYWFPQARLAYHFPLSPNPTLRNIDLYAAAFGGPTFARLEARKPGGELAYRGDAVGPHLGAAAGILYFFGRHLHIGFEFRIRYAQGDYAVRDQAPDYEVKDAIEHRYYASGFNWMAFVGARF